MSYYFHIPDPDSLSDEDWVRRYAELKYIRNSEKG
jgi:acyl carrier protein phosphodiesterase